MTLLRSCLFAATSFAALPLSAQPVTTGEPVVVTATRQSQAQSDVLAAVSVLDRDAIEAAGGFDVLGLLRQLPGLDVVRGAGIGQQAAVFLRGTNANHALVLIDGVRISALGTGAYAWEQLPLAQIERIEVVRGPRAALWGADALGGVIQIFTRRNIGTQWALHAGNHDTYGVEAGTGRQRGNGGFGLHAAWLDSRGTNATTPANWSFDPDRDGATLRSVSANARHRLGDQELQATLLHNDNDIQFDQGESNTRQQVLALALEGALGPDWQHRVTLGGSRDRLDTPDSFTRYHSQREQADWQHHLAPGHNDALTLGLSWLHERGRQHDSLTGSDVYAQSRHTASAFGAWQRRAGAHALELSGRYDDNSVYGSESSFGAAWGWELGRTLRFTASWGQGFRAPTMNELYSPGWGGWYAGNPALHAEHSDSAELGLHWHLAAAGRFSLRAFRNDIDGLIDFAGENAQALNIARARIDGVEIEWDRQLGDWHIGANATWQDPLDRDSGARLLRRPPRKANLSLERIFANGARVGIEGHAASQRPDFGTRLPGYGLLALHGQWPLGGGFRLDGRIDNLLDRDYTLIDAYNTPGLTVLLGLRWQAH
ncbi:MAG: TonB-dependent receptor [Lysobacteraceae bacterium]